MDQELPFAKPFTVDESNMVELTNGATAHTSFTRVEIVLDSKLVFTFSFRAYSKVELNIILFVPRLLL